MFYTKYRPQKFSEISKPNDTAESLMNQVKNGKVDHAYLFVGPRGTGKTTTARILAKALNCSNIQPNGDPCDECDNCLAIKSGNFIDLIEIDAASNRGIDDIRELKDRIKLAPSQGSRKVYIIDEVHMLTNEAFNALLKTLEEPPKHVNFILCTTELHKVPETIKSRCQVFKFKRATVDQLVEKLSNIAKQEKAKISKEDLKKIAVASLGGFRDAETMLQQVVDGSLNVDALLNAGTRQEYFDFMELLRSGDVGEALRTVNRVFDDGVDLYVWTGELVKYLRDLLYISVSADRGLVETTDELYWEMKLQAISLGSHKIGQVLESIMKAQNGIKSSFITQLPVELAIAELTISESSGFEMTKDPKPKKPIGGTDDFGRMDTKASTVDNKKKSTETKKSTTAGDVKANTDEEKYERPFVGAKAGNIDEGESSGNDEDSVLDETDAEQEELEVSFIQPKWDTFLSAVREQNSSIQTLLKSATIVGVDGRYIMLEVAFAFHKDRLQADKNRKLIEGMLSEIYGQNLSIKCVVNSQNRPKKPSNEKETGNLTDLNVVSPATNVSVDDALDLFDGNLPLG
jgi:DNA polymerase-3 subunit gamma/tau